jgi:hypothetical protein
MTVKALLAVFLGALIVRLSNIASIALGDGSFLIEDSPLYYAIVDDWVRLGAYLRDPGNGDLYREWERLPAYPAFLLGLEYVFERSDAMVAIAQALLDSATCVLIAAIVGRHSVRAGLIAGVLACLWPNLIIVSSLVVNDTLFLFFLVLAAWAILRALDNGRVVEVWAVIGGLCFGLSCITRPVLFYFIPIIAAACLYYFISKRPGIAKAVCAWALFLFALTLPIGGVLQANHAAHGKWFMTLQGGVHLMGWVLPRVAPETRHMPLDQASAYWLDRFNAEWTARETSGETEDRFDELMARQDFAVRELSDVHMSNLAITWTEGAIKNVMTPAVLLDNRMRAAAPDRSGISEGAGAFEELIFLIMSAGPGWLIVVAVASGLAVLTTGAQVVGAVRLARIHPILLLLLISYVGYMLGLLGPVFNPKYRLPIEPVLLGLTALGLEWLWEWSSRTQFVQRRWGS